MDHPTGTVTFLFSDVVGSSRRWEEEHDAMEQAMAVHDHIIGAAVEGAHGSLVKQTGDGVFAVFGSAFDALAAALGMQDALHAGDWATNEPLRIRIGVHTGEANLRGGDYFGSAVNRAARVMSLAQPGEVVLSRATQEVVQDRLPDGMRLDDLGERELRGMTRHEHLFRLTRSSEGGVLAPGGTPEVRDEQCGLQRAAWIAVLPFENLSGDPDQEYFADGISEDVITALAAYRSLRVIARTSSFRYKAANASIAEIGRDLGVRFVLEGSVRKSGNRIRVTAQLVEAPGGQHLWADRYDFDLGDMFDVQDRLTLEIVRAIDPAIRGAATERIARARPARLDAWDHVQRGLSFFLMHKKEANAKARGLFEAAIELDPGYSQAFTGLSYTHAWDGWLLWVDEPLKSLELAYDLAKTAVELDSQDALAYSALGFANYGLGRMDGAIEATDRAIHLNASLAMPHLVGGVARIHGGSDPEEGVRMAGQALELSPRDPSLNWFYGGRAIGNFVLRRLDDAVADARAAIKTRYGYLFGRVVLTAALAELGDLGEARKELEAILGLRPDFDPSFLDLYTFSNEEDRRRLLAGLRAAELSR